MVENSEYHRTNFQNSLEIVIMIVNKISKKMIQFFFDIQVYLQTQKKMVCSVKFSM